MPAEHDVPRTDVAGTEAFQQFADLARLENMHRSAGRSIGRQDREQHGASAGQYLGKLMAFAFAGPRELARVAAAGRSQPEPRADATEDDLVVFSPRPSAQRLVGKQPLGGAAIERSGPQLTILGPLKAEPSAVWREEHVASFFRARDRLRIDSVQVASVENVSTAVVGPEHHGSAVRRHGKMNSWCP